MRKWLLRMVTLLIASGIIGFLSGALSSESFPGVTPTNFPALYRGMSEEEVIEIIGAPDSRTYVPCAWISLFRNKEYSAEIVFGIGGALSGSLFKDGKKTATLREDQQI